MYVLYSAVQESRVKSHVADKDRGEGRIDLCKYVRISHARAVINSAVYGVLILTLLRMEYVGDPPQVKGTRETRDVGMDRRIAVERVERREGR